MKAIVALEELIKEDENHIKLAKKQLADHESGVNRLSSMILASTETSIEESSTRLEVHTKMLSELLSKNVQELEKEEKLREAIVRKNYFHYQKVRIKRDITRSNDEKIEAMMIIDELPRDFGFKDANLFSVAEKSLKLNLSLHEEIENKFVEIIKEFEELTKNISDEQIEELGLLNYQIPVLITQFYMLLTNILENLKEDDQKKQNLDSQNKNEQKEYSINLPKFEDWWIKELWVNHQAYFALYKWKKIISSFCKSSDQKRAWEVIFSNWVNVKKQITNKGVLGFEYNFAFDTLMRNHCGLEEELATTSLESMEVIINKLLEKEDFTKLISDESHKLVTKYTIFKREKIDYKDIKGKKPKKQKKGKKNK